MQNNGGLKTLTKYLPAVRACPVNVHDGPLADGPASSAPLTFIDVGAGIYSGTRGHEDFAELDALADPNDSDALLLLALFRNQSVVHARAASTNLSQPSPSPFIHTTHHSQLPLTTHHSQLITRPAPASAAPPTPPSPPPHPNPHPRSHRNRTGLRDESRQGEAAGARRAHPTDRPRNASRSASTFTRWALGTPRRRAGSSSAGEVEGMRTRGVPWTRRRPHPQPTAT